MCSLRKCSYPLPHPQVSFPVVCLVHCKKFNLQYVGSTTTEFKVSTGTTISSMKTNKKKLTGLILYFIIIFYLFCCFVLYKTVHSPLFSRKMVEIARFELRTAIQHQCQNYLGGRGGLGGSEKNRRTVITSLQLAFRRRNRNFTPFTIH